MFVVILEESSVMESGGKLYCLYLYEIIGVNLQIEERKDKEIKEKVI